MRGKKATGKDEIRYSTTDDLVREGDFDLSPPPTSGGLLRVG
jgi:hypothetical protein